MERRRYGREFKLEAVKLVRERGVSVGQAARDLDIHANLLRNWVKALAADPQHAFPGQGQMKPEQLEIERLRREVTKLKAERDILKKSRGLLREGLDMKFSFIAKHRGIWPAKWLCEALGVSRSGLHAWLTRPPRARSRSDEALVAKVRASFIATGRTYGARRMWHDMLAEGSSCGLHRIERLMQSQALRARPRRRRLPSDSGQRIADAVSPNVLDRQFHAPAPNRKWIADFTYVWTTEGWLYVAAVIDLFSRRVVGWSMSATMTAQLVTDALMMAIWRRGKPDALLHHSDEGSPISERALPAADGRQRRDLLDEPIRQRLGQRGDGKLPNTKLKVRHHREGICLRTSAVLLRIKQVRTKGHSLLVLQQWAYRLS